jgi:hypothetical protein
MGSFSFSPAPLDDDDDADILYLGMCRQHFFVAGSYAQYVDDADADADADAGSLPPLASDALHDLFVMQLNTSDIAPVSYSINATYPLMRGRSCAPIDRILSAYDIDASESARSMFLRCFLVSGVR